MTEDLFNRRHGLAWDQFKKSPMFGDLLRLADGTASPAVQVHKLDLGQMAANSTALVASIAGFGMFRALLLKLGSSPPPPEQEPDFSMSIEEQFEQDNPPDPKPKAERKR